MRSPVCVPILALLTLAGCAADSHVAGEPAAHSKATVLLTQSLPADVGREGRLLTVEYPPGGSTPAHHHDGAIFAYVAEGAVVTALDDGPEQRFEAGQAWYERPGQVHRVSRNASTSRPAKLVVFFLTQPGTPPLRMQK
jgi:quercetin dioxygenase-like cupin family protein